MRQTHQRLIFVLQPAHRDAAGIELLTLIQRKFQG